MAVEGRLTKKKMIDTLSLFKQRRRSIGRGDGSRPAEVGERGLKVAQARARRLRERRPEIGWSRDCWRCAAASKPAPAGLGEIKNKTNKLAKRPGGWGRRGLRGGAAGRRGLRIWSLRGAGRRTAAPEPRAHSLPGNRGAGPDDSEGCGQLVMRLGGELVFPHSPRRGSAAGGRETGRGRFACSWALHAAPTSRTARTRVTRRGAGRPPAWVP